MRCRGSTWARVWVLFLGLRLHPRVRVGDHIYFWHKIEPGLMWLLEDNPPLNGHLEKSNPNRWFHYENSLTKL
jgi:hypothetical protein